MFQQYYKWLAKRRLIHRYLYLNEVNKILEDYITKKIMDGGSPEFISKTRQELVENQRNTKENSNFIEYLKKHE